MRHASGHPDCAVDCAHPGHGSSVALVRHRYGGGEPYLDVTGDPILRDDELETVLSYPEPIGNVAVSQDGRGFFTVHPESRPEGAKLLEFRDGIAWPYPDEALQDDLFQTPLGVVIDRQYRLWIIDHGKHGFDTPRLVAIDLLTDEVVHDHSFNNTAAPGGSFLQDLQVSPDGRTVFIADVSFWRKRPAIVVHDVATATDRRVLERHPSVSAQDWIIQTPCQENDILWRVGGDEARYRRHCGDARRRCGSPTVP